MSEAQGSTADRSAWPLLRAERTWGSWRLGIALATAAAATWCYLIGEYVGYYLGFVRGALALTAGSMIGMLLVLLAAGPTCIRFGIESVASTKPQFGSRGWVVPAILQWVSIVGWNSLLLIFFAKSLSQLLMVLGWLPPGFDARQIVPLVTLAACAVVFLVLLRGADGVSRLSNILVLHVFVGLWMLLLLVTRRWPELIAGHRADDAFHVDGDVDLQLARRRLRVQRDGLRQAEPHHESESDDEFSCVHASSLRRHDACAPECGVIDA